MTDLKRMIVFHVNSVTADIFVDGKEGFDPTVIKAHSSRQVTVVHFIFIFFKVQTQHSEVCPMIPKCYYQTTRVQNRFLLIFYHFFCSPHFLVCNIHSWTLWHLACVVIFKFFVYHFVNDICWDSGMKLAETVNHVSIPSVAANTVVHDGKPLDTHKNSVPEDANRLVDVPINSAATAEKT